MKWAILIFMALGLLVSAAYAQSLFEYDRVDFFKGVDTQEKVKEIVSKEDPETQRLHHCRQRRPWQNLRSACHYQIL